MKWQITEKLIVVIWQQKLVTRLIADTGEKVEIIYPGKRNFAEGPDFTGAVFEMDGRVVEGEVELHVASSEWYGHGHNRDARADNVVLHVVWYYDTYQQAKLRNGKTVPTIALSQALGSIVQRLGHSHMVLAEALPRCPNSHHVPVLSIATLTGEARFFARVNSIKNVLARDKATQVLVKYLSRALGYAQNSVPFEKLADGLPAGVLEDNMGNTERKALLFGFAGLLPSQRVAKHWATCNDGEVRELEAIWGSTNNRRILDEGEWRFYRVRPDNFPPRRISALSELLSRYDGPGLLDGILGLLREAPCGAERSWLEKGLKVDGVGYWGNHIDFGAIKSSNSAQLGKEKAAEIVVNVVLPFTFAWGEVFTEPHLSEKAFAVFQRYGKVVDNEITRYMQQQLGFPPELELSASQHQGLVHLFKTYCHARKCASCPLASPERGWATHLYCNG